MCHLLAEAFAPSCVGGHGGQQAGGRACCGQGHKEMGPEAPIYPPLAQGGFLEIRNLCWRLVIAQSRGGRRGGQWSRAQHTVLGSGPAWGFAPRGHVPQTPCQALRGCVMRGETRSYFAV